MARLPNRLRVGLAALLVVACIKESTQPNPRQPASVQIVSGDLQSGPVGRELPNPLVVKVLDAAAQPQAGQLVNFRVTSGGGSVFAGASLTNASGVAQERWTLGTNTAASQRVEARAVDNVTGAALTFAVFTATALAGPPAQVTARAGNGQTAAAGSAVAIPPSVIVRDQFQNLVPGATVIFAVAAGGGSITGASQTTTAGGIATVGSWTLGTTPGTNTLTATVSGLPVVTFTATGTAVPVASVAVTPPAASVVVGGTVQLTATPMDATGNPLSGRVVTWATSNGTVATVNGSGLVTGLGLGSATITATSETKSGASAITVTAPPPTASSCLTQTGPTTTVSGVQTSAFSNTSLPDNTKIDASTAQFLTDENISIQIGGGSHICFHGGETIGKLPPSTSWSTMLKAYSVVPDGPNVTVEDVRTFDRGDGVAFGTNVPNWTLRRAYVHYARDGCVENHFLFSGTVADALLDGCFIGFASRPYTTTQDGSNNLMTITNTLVRLQPMDGVYTGTAPGHGGFYEWSAISPKLSLHDNVFRADQKSNDGDEYMAPPPGKLADCSNNIMIWLGSGPFPEALPSCFTVLTGAVGLQYWNNAVAQWKANHPNTLPDVGPPIVSVFSPSNSATLTGTVTLTATAVDDRAVAGVQFRLNGQSVGSEVTADSPVTKYTLSWDSRSRPNGIYTLTATARDAAGNTTTSAGISVTISN